MRADPICERMTDCVVPPNLDTIMCDAGGAFVRHVLSTHDSNRGHDHADGPPSATSQRLSRSD